ncbi:hypothetical protein J3R82DRAFT_9379 [Butyriboletus roseoflavus]|nr:hypothetical protein J3R82DRAFT_9379 [Butyriboletus roseoflavus]
MNNDNQDNNNTRGRPFPHGFNIGTTIQNVFRNINHAFARDHDSSSGSRDRTNNNMSPLEPLNSVDGRHDTHPTVTAHPAAPNPSISSAFPPADVDMPPHPQLDSQRDEDDDSMPELRSDTDSSNDSDVGLAAFNLVPPHQGIHVDDDRNSVWTDTEGDPPPLEPMIGTRRARVDDDGDDARDRRHPSERVGGPPPPGDAAPQNANPQQPPRPPPGLFGALFGVGPPPGDAQHEHTHTGEGTADPSPADNNPTPGHAPRGVPILIAGFTFTIPLVGHPPGNPTGPAGGGQGAAPGMFGMDAAAREELLASFTAFFQEFHGLDEAREDPERAKKLVAGLEVVPFGLVKRLERVGGAPGGHLDSNAEGSSSSGCAICWDSLLDVEGDRFSGRQFSGGEVPQSSEAHTEDHVMDVDAPPASDPPCSDSEAAKIICLPCAHVFHTSCLLPWFTRARQATCPTCRFNIDPENLTYTPPPRRVFSRGPPAQPGNAVPNPAPADPQAAAGVPLEARPAGVRAADAAAPSIDPTTADAHAATDAVPPGPVPIPPAGQGGAPPGFDPFVAMPGVPSGMPMLSFPAIQVPLRPNGAQAPGDGNQGTSFLPTTPHLRTVSLPSSTNEYPFAPAGIDVVTIGFDMFVGGPPPEERGGDARDNAEGTDNGGAGIGAAGGNGAANPNGLAQDLHSLIEGLLRTTRNIIPQVINAQGPAPAVGAQPQPQAMPAPEATGPQPVPPPMGHPRVVPIIPLRPNMFRPTRPMPPHRERKTWILPPAPGPSLRQRIEQREREQGLRCSDTSCGVGPCDDDPYPEPSVSLTKQVSIQPLPEPNGHAPVCAHAFHPACLVSAERVAGWGSDHKTEPLVEVSCPVCRSVGCVTREVWELGVSAL